MQIIWLYNKDCKLDMLKDYWSNEGNSVHNYYNVAVYMGRKEICWNLIISKRKIINGQRGHNV